MGERECHSLPALIITPCPTLGPGKEWGGGGRLLETCFAGLQLCHYSGGSTPLAVALPYPPFLAIAPPRLCNPPPLTA